jgi:nitroreductase
MLRDLIKKTRSYRRFHRDHTIQLETLKELVELARLSAAAGNLQPLKYMLSNDSEKNDTIFQNLGWAGYLKDWPGPGKGERPSAYIIVLGDRRICKSFGCDHGIACQNIMLGAVEKGLGGCMIGSVNREILLVVALGKPKETVVLETVGPDGDIKYWRDSEGVHHVPKRSLEDIIVG